MGEITLVRHGQANSGAQDEASYDRLSDLGQQQAAWLGDWMRAQEERFDLVLAGSLERQVHTARAMGFEPEIDPDLNEMDYFNLSRALGEVHGVTEPKEPDDFAPYMQHVLEAWHRAEIQGEESFADFEARVTRVLERAAEPGKRVLCVTSGGVIAMMLRALLGLDSQRLTHILLPIRNTSVHRVNVRPYATFLAGYNAIPHLEAPERAEARTYF